MRTFFAWFWRHVSLYGAVKYTNSAPTTNVMGVVLNYIWASSRGALENVECLFIAITPRSTLKWIRSNC